MKTKTKCCHLETRRLQAGAPVRSLRIRDSSGISDVSP